MLHSSLSRDSLQSFSAAVKGFWPTVSGHASAQKVLVCRVSVLAFFVAVAPSLLAARFLMRLEAWATAGGSSTRAESIIERGSRSLLRRKGSDGPLEGQPQNRAASHIVSGLSLSVLVWGQ